MREMPVLSESNEVARCARRDELVAELTRRGFLTQAALAVAAAALAGCGGGGGGDATGPDGGGTGGGNGGGNGGGTPNGVVVNGDVVTISLAAVPALQARDGFLLVSSAQVFVLRDESDGFLAFGSICPHEGCNVSTYRSGRIVCPCHGSQFDKRGVPESGPAVGMGSLPLYGATLDAATQTLTVRKS